MFLNLKFDPIITLQLEFLLLLVKFKDNGCKKIENRLRVSIKNMLEESVIEMMSDLMWGCFQ